MNAKKSSVNRPVSTHQGATPVTVMAEGEWNFPRTWIHVRYVSVHYCNCKQTFTLQHSLILFLLCEENKHSEMCFDCRTSYRVCLLLLEGVLNPCTWGGCSAALLLSGCASKGNNWRGEDDLEWQWNALTGFDACKGVVICCCYNWPYIPHNLVGLWSPVRLNST